ncbi:MAG: glycosyltransferase family 4 protein [Lachnospiraceae bacterium]|nr:glycosyltransferase family 4 protein [Lachnospiraceae bacterium]
MIEAFKREAKRRVLSGIHAVQARTERKRVNDILKFYDPAVISNPEQIERQGQIGAEGDGAPLTIWFIITRMVRFHGGQTSVLRLGTELAKQGFAVGYAVYKAQSKEEMELCARSNLAGYQGKLYTRQELAAGKPDIVIATSWDTVSFAKRLPGYKMYFVQDYEPYFYSFGELFLLAKKTYEQGLHMVSLGKWNRDMILRECKPVSPVDVVDFPCEKKEYPRIERKFESYRTKKTLIFAVYLKYYGKRLPCIIPHLLEELAEEFKKDGVVLDVRYYGEAKNFTSKGGRNLGMLNKQELYQLYAEADFGMVASMSNISLVPYEMLAAGLPVIEFEDGTFTEFFPEDCAILTSLSGRELYQRLKAAMADPEGMKRRQERAKEQLDLVSWEKTGAQFAEIIRGRCL